MAGDLITNFNSSYENEFSFEPGRGHVIGHLCIRLVLHIKVVSIEKSFIDFGLLKANFGHQP